MKKLREIKKRHKMESRVDVTSAVPKSNRRSTNQTARLGDTRATGFLSRGSIRRAEWESGGDLSRAEYRGGVQVQVKKERAQLTV
jgi:hypothetical protein|tara:strand:+ start:381 stop:635 length:255 start_codon:yes stop_codon:yes gene_type:complete